MLKLRASNLQKWHIFNFYNPWNWFHVKSKWQEKYQIFTLHYRAETAKIYSHHFSQKFREIIANFTRCAYHFNRIPLVCVLYLHRSALLQQVRNRYVNCEWHSASLKYQPLNLVCTFMHSFAEMLLSIPGVTILSCKTVQKMGTEFAMHI